MFQGPRPRRLRRVPAVLNPGSGQRHDLDGLRPFLPLLDLVLDALVFLQRSESLGFDAAVVSENVAAAIIGFDESESFCLIEPLNNACGHIKALYRMRGKRPRRASDESMDDAEWLEEVLWRNFDVQRGGAIKA
jgi:hypothetical protein